MGFGDLVSDIINTTQVNVYRKHSSAEILVKNKMRDYFTQLLFACIYINKM